MNIKTLCELPRDQFEDWCRLRSGSYPLEPETALCRVLGQFPFYADRQDRHFAPHLILDGYWESWIGMAMGRIVQPGWRCVDVGANHGYFTVLLSKLVGDKGAVTALEPCSRTYRLLNENLRINGCANVHALRLAAGETDVEAMTLSCKHDNPSGASLLPAPVDHPFRATEDSESVRVTCLDSLALGQVDFMKIDTEGMDYNVMRGARQTLTNNPQCIVVCEHAGFLLGSREREAALLAEVMAGGILLRFIDYDGNVKVVTAEEVLADTQRVWNLVFRA